jgi:hypothetical protein
MYGKTLCICKNVFSVVFAQPLRLLAQSENQQR